jgi:phage shock protein E
MKYFYVIAIVIISVALLAACAPAVLKAIAPAARGSASPSPVGLSPSPAASAARAKAVKITPADAKKRLDTETGIVLLDVRNADEYAAGHIKGSTLLPLDTIAAAESKISNKDTVIIVYCHSGRRSALAAAALVKMGYTNVNDLGGIMNWPYEVVKD